MFATSSTQLSITDFFLPFNVQNPVKVTLLSPVDSFNMIEFCFSPSFIPFPDQLINTCHSGGYGSFYSTNTSEIHSLNQSTRKSIKFQEKLSQSFQTNSQSSPFSVFINLQPYQNYFVGAIGSNSSITLQLDYTCMPFPFDFNLISN